MLLITSHAYCFTQLNNETLETSEDEFLDAFSQQQSIASTYMDANDRVPEDDDSSDVDFSSDDDELLDMLEDNSSRESSIRGSAQPTPVPLSRSSSRGAETVSFEGLGPEPSPIRMMMAEVEEDLHEEEVAATFGGQQEAEESFKVDDDELTAKSGSSAEEDAASVVADDVSIEDLDEELHVSMVASATADDLVADVLSTSWTEAAEKLEASHALQRSLAVADVAGLEEDYFAEPPATDSLSTSRELQHMDVTPKILVQEEAEFSVDSSHNNTGYQASMELEEEEQHQSASDEEEQPASDNEIPSVLDASVLDATGDDEVAGWRTVETPPLDSSTPPPIPEDPMEFLVYQAEADAQVAMEQAKNLRRESLSLTNKLAETAHHVSTLENREKEVLSELDELKLQQFDEEEKHKREIAALTRQLEQAKFFAETHQRSAAAVRTQYASVF